MAPKSYRQVITHYGNIYHKQLTLSGATVTKFTTAAMDINRARILVTDNSVLCGSSTGQAYTMAANITLDLEKFNLHTLCFKNLASTLAGKVTIVAVRG